MAALASEVLWARIMVYVLGNFVHSFSLVLMSFLFGIALGSSVMSRRLARPGIDIRTFAALQLGIGVVALTMIPLFAPLVGLRELFLDRLTGAGATLETPDPWWPFTFWRMGISFLMLTVPTFLMGASFPIAAKIYARGAKRTGRGVGDVYAVNTTGAIVGSFLASFVLVGAFGVRASAMGAAFVSVGLAVALFWLSPSPLPVRDTKRPSKKRSRSRSSSRTAGRSGGGSDRAGAIKVGATCVGVAAVALALVGIPRDVFVPMYATAERGMALIYVDESPSGTVTVHRAPSGNMVLDINGQNVAGTKFGFLSTQKLQAHFPVLAHPDPKSVMQIGFGSGGTCWSISTHPEIERMDCVEISPSVIEASERYMEGMHHNVLDDPRVSLEIEDARNFVLATDRKYDIILSDSIHPNYVGNGSLYTSDYFELCSTRLDEDGILSFWLPTYLLSVEDYKMIVRSLHSVFPHIVIWYMNNTVEGYSVTMGSKSPIKLDLDRVRRALAHESVRADLAQVRMDDPLAIADCLAVYGDAVDEFLGEGLLNTEDRPLIEFRASRNMLRERGEWMNLREIASARRFPGEMIVNWGADAEEEARLRETMQRYFDATTHILEGHLHHILRDARAELREYEAALAINPDDVDAPYLAERVVRLSRRLPVD
jgi:spermidine synthase